jgi:RepB plasmid partitioning protein
MNAIWQLKKMEPVRQIEAAQLMVAMNKYTLSYAKSLVAGTPQGQLVDKRKPKVIKGLTNEQLTLMKREAAVWAGRCRSPFLAQPRH